MQVYQIFANKIVVLLTSKQGNRLRAAQRRVLIYADDHSSVSPSNVPVPYGGIQQFNMTADSGYYISGVYIDGVDHGNLMTYNFTNIQDNHTISVTSATFAPTNTLTPTQTNPCPTETILITATAIVALIAAFA